MSEVFISYLHYLAFATLASALALELVLFRTEVSGTTARHLARIDAIYGASALAALGSGLMRLFFYGKPASYYMQNGWPVPRQDHAVRRGRAAVHLPHH